MVTKCSLVQAGITVAPCLWPGYLGDQGCKDLDHGAKLIADVGLVGYPNAGKSTLLRKVSNAKPKVAPYHFTTLRPYLGVMHYNDRSRVTFADIPGLIEGAHANRGLGHTFLRHIERTKMLLYVLDGASTEGRDPGADLKCLMEELRLYNPSLMKKPAMVFANKIDLRGLFYRDCDEVRTESLLDVKRDTDKDRTNFEVETDDGIISGEDVYRGIENNKVDGKISYLEIVAAEAGLTIVDGSANSGEGIPKLAILIKAKIEGNETEKTGKLR